MRVTAITPMKNEGPFILEWLAYHSLIGVNDFVVFSNDCDDGTDAILERLDELGFVRHLPNPSCMRDAANGHHWAAMAYVDAMPRLRRSDWIVSFDVDEFICVNTGLGRLEDLFAATQGADFVSMNQLNFGCAGVETYDPHTMLIRQFDRAMYKTNVPYGWNRARGIKTLTRGAAPFDRIGNHSPRVSRTDLKWVNGNGVPLPPDLYCGPLKSVKDAHFGYDLVQLNHYALRSMENYLVKTDRGDANGGAMPDEKYWRQYWNRYDDNVALDQGIQRWAGRTQLALNELLKDGELNKLHHASVAWHQSRITKLQAFDMQAGIYGYSRRRHQRKLQQELQTAQALSAVA